MSLESSFLTLSEWKGTFLHYEWLLIGIVRDSGERSVYRLRSLLIREEELKDQLFGYVGMSEQELKVAKDKLDDLLLELQKKENLLQEEKNKQNKQWTQSIQPIETTITCWRSPLLVLFFLQEILFLL